MTEKKNKNYLTHDTELAIIKYVNTQDIVERNKIYREEIHYALYKLTQNVIHTFKFYHTEVENLEHLQHEIITFLLSKMHLFDPSRGAKAYSYFGTIAKRYLILYNNANYKKLKEKAEVDAVDEDKTIFIDLVNEEHNNMPLNKFIDLFVKHIDDNLWKYFPK